MIPRTLADDVRIHANQSVLHREGVPCTMSSRLQNAIEDTFVFMDSMGAAISIGKSSLYASDGDMRREMSRIRWGTRLDAERGGQLRHDIRAGAYSAEEFANIASDIMGQTISFTRENRTETQFVSLPRTRPLPGIIPYI